MKWTSAFRMVAGAMLLLATLTAQQDSTSQSVIAKENEWNQAFKTGDRQTIARLLSDQYLITEEDGKVYDKQGYISLISDDTLHVDVSEFKDLQVRVHGDTALVVGAYHCAGVQKGERFELFDRFTDVWQRDRGGWHLIGSQYSTAPKPQEGANPFH